MENSIFRTHVNLDGLHTLEISVDKENKTVIADIVVPDEPPMFIYAEKFDEPCNYMKNAIKKGIVFLRGEQTEEMSKPEIRNIH